MMLYGTKMVGKRHSKSLHRSIIFMTAMFSFIYFCEASPIDSQTNVCKTPGCYKSAQQVLKNLDATFNPCDNFYRFTCGKFNKEEIIPEDKSGVSLFSKKIDRLQNQLKQSIEGQLDKSDPRTFKLLQSYYSVCLNSEKMGEIIMKEVKDILNNLGNWPVAIGKSWDESNFDWKNMTYQLRKMGYTESIRSLIGFYVEFDEKHNTRNILVVDQAQTGIDQEYLSKGLEEKVVQAYYKYMVEVAKILGADPIEAEKELAESLNFEIELAKVSLSMGERRNTSQLYNLKTVGELESEYPNIPWNAYLNKLVSPQSHVDLADKVIVAVPNFLKSFSQLIATTPKRIVANYVVWRVIQESAEHMNEQVRKVKAEFSASLRGTTVQQPRWVQCISYVSDNLHLATGALYSRKNYDKKSKSDMENLVKELRKSFTNMLNEIDWMDKETKKAALVKLNSVEPYVAYPDEFFDNEKLDNYFEKLEVDANSFFKSHLRLNLFNFERELEQLKEPLPKTSWITHGKSAVINAFYAFSENAIKIPAGILQGEFYTSTRPKYMNYGAIGFAIGHELTHGFDDQGSQYDEDGNLADWWDAQTKTEYFKRAQCMIDQYNNYTVAEVGLNLNGKNTLGENIADNGGVKEAYFAYEHYEKLNGEEPRLPGLPYTPRQMFWISSANVWCAKYRTEALRNRVLTNEHSHNDYRVIGPLSNNPQFSRDFNCPVGSPMNPVKKCTVW